MEKLGVLACDIGGSGGKIAEMLFDGGRLKIGRTARFPNKTIEIGNSLYWDTLGIYQNICEALITFRGSQTASIGIDAFSNDFVLLDKDGFVLENPHTYRDLRTEGMIEQMDRIVARRELYDRTGIQCNRMNTLYQLLHLSIARPRMLDMAEKLLFIPDLLAYYFTGSMANEYTLASVSQLWDPKHMKWDMGLADLIGLKRSILGNIAMPGEVIGELTDRIAKETIGEKLPVVAVGAHDTASAVAGTPILAKDCLFISSGTWCIVGTEISRPLITEKSAKYSLANEGGVMGTIRLLKNIVGMWIFEECRRIWSVAGQRFTAAELCEQAEDAEPFGAVFDPDDALFYTPGDMPENIRSYAKKTGQPIPETTRGIVRSIYESISLKIRYVIETIEDTVEKKLSVIHIVGGGAQNRLFNQMIADCTGKAVYAGPVDATAMGNGLMQLIAMGELSSLDEGREIIAGSMPPELFEPRGTESWDECYAKFQKIIGV